MGDDGARCAVIIVQAVWISYGVIMRYVFRSPDASSDRSYGVVVVSGCFRTGWLTQCKLTPTPAQTMLVNKFSPATRMRLEVFHCFLIAAIAAFFAVAAAQAAWRDYSFRCGIGNFGTLAALFVLGAFRIIFVFIFALCNAGRARKQHLKQRRLTG